MQRERLVVPVLAAAGLGSVALAAWLRGDGPPLVLQLSPTACVSRGGSLRLHSVDHHPVICSGDRCTFVDEGGPPRERNEFDGHVDDSRVTRTAANEICLEGTRSCTRIGPNLAAALDGAISHAPHATSDLKAVVVMDEQWNVELWSVARDRFVLPAPPAPQYSSGYHVIGPNVLAHVGTEGPDTHADVIDSSGRVITAHVDGGGMVLQLGDEHFAHYTAAGTLQILDRGGAVVARASLGDPDGSIRYELEVFDAEHVAVVVPARHVLRMVRFDPGDESLYVEADRFFQDCE